MSRATSVRQDQPRARRRTDAAATASTRWSPCCSESTSTTRSSVEPADALIVDGFAEDTIVREAPSRARRRRRRRARAGAFGSRSGSRSPPDSAVGAATPRLPCGLQTPTLDARRSSRRAPRIAARIGADVPFFLRGGAQLATGDGTRTRAGRAAVRLLGRARRARRRCEGVDRRRSTPRSTSVAAPTASSSAPTALRLALAAIADSSRSGNAPRERPRVVSARTRTRWRPEHSARMSQVQARRCTASSSATTDADSAAASLQRAGRTLVTRPLDAGDLPRVAR